MLPCRPVRSARALLHRARKQLLLPLVLISCCAALPAQAAGGGPSSPSAGLTITGGGGSASELLNRLTLPQLATMINTSPQRLGVQFAAQSGPFAAEMGVLTEEPTTTVQDVLDFMAAQGVSTAPVEQLLSGLTAGLTATPQQLQATIGRVLSDLSEGGQLAALAHELGLTPAALEAAQLVPSTAQQLATALGTSSEQLSSTLRGTGAIAQALSPLAPLVAAPVENSKSRTTTLLIGTRNGRGGVSLAAVSAAPSATAPGSPAARASNAFSIVKVRVARNGLILETVKLPGPGQLAIKASTPRRAAVRARSGHRRTVTRTSTIGAVRRALAGGLHTITLRLHEPTGRTLRLAVTLATTYTPSGGTARTLRRHLTIHDAGRGRRR